ncbi:MAG: PAS domain S-box protein [Bacteroidales bacterium]|nr:PAS domain S-box protein [Bacteroidales bacterium]
MHSSPNEVFDVIARQIQESPSENLTLNLEKACIKLAHFIHADTIYFLQKSEKLGSLHTLMPIPVRYLRFISEIYQNHPNNFPLFSPVRIKQPNPPIASSDFVLMKISSRAGKCFYLLVKKSLKDTEIPTDDLLKVGLVLLELYTSGLTSQQVNQQPYRELAIIDSSSKGFAIDSELTLDAVLLHDCKGVIYNCNDIFSALIHEEGVGKNVFDYLQDTSLQCKVSQLHSRQIIHTQGVIVPAEKNRMIPVEVSCTQYAEKVSDLYIMIIKNLAALEVRDPQSLASEQRYQSIVSNLCYLVYCYRFNPATLHFTLDWIEGKVEDVPFENPADIFDLQKYHSVVHPDDLGSVQEKQSNLVKGKSFTSQYRIMTSQGTYKWVKDYNWHFGDTEGGMLKFYGVIQDLSADFRKDEQIRLLWTAISYSSNVIIILDDKRNIEFINQAISNEVGMEPLDLVENSIDLLIQKMDSTLVIDDYLLEKNFEQIVSDKITYLNKEGIPQTALLTVTPLFNEQRGVYKYVVVTQNITHLNELESRLLQNDKLSTLGLFASGIAHDFNNILQIISTFTELVEAKAPEDKAIQSYIHQIKDAKDRGTQIVRNLLSFGKPSEKAKVEVQVSRIMNESSHLLNDLIPERIKLRFEVIDDFKIFASETEILQVIINLVVNAMQAIESRGAISVKSYRSAGLNENLYGIIEVEDTGKGIPETHHNQVFNPYFSTKTQGDGTGLGLAIVQSIVSDHGGTIHFHSELGLGTRFFISIPLSQVETE